MADEKDVVVDFLKSKSASKSKFYFKDFTDLFPDKGPREVKKILTKLVNEEVLEFWSSGSTTMYGLKGAGKQAHTEGEDSSSRLRLLNAPTATSVRLQRPLELRLLSQEMPQLLLWHFLFFRPPADPFPRSSP